MTKTQGASIHITGIVQGVGFRPFVYALATRYALTGWVCNTSAGVDIAVDGSPLALESFVQALKQEPPPLARIDAFESARCPPHGFTTFEIVHSKQRHIFPELSKPGDFIPISPDVSICADCLREMRDPADHRYRYPFINCTNCGPRFTIIEDIPYDRPKTTMAPFEMCEYCRSEYENPLNRRFHAQPVACPECGPHVWLEELVTGNWVIGNSPPITHTKHDALQQARLLLSDGKILAIKGLGGFHLACDATNPEAVAELRRRKLRVDKPFALMMPDVKTVERHCFLSDAERDLLESRERPAVILQRKRGFRQKRGFRKCIADDTHPPDATHPHSPIAEAVAPNQRTLGVMLPYTPLHYLLFTAPSPLAPLVMTSGNLSEEPIATGNNEARERLGKLADAFLMHNREIRTRCDDSVVKVIGKQLSVISDQLSVNSEQSKVQNPQLPTTHYPLRRSRGYAPNPIHLPWDIPPLLATGGELKNTFCLTRGRYAFLSHHIGNLENYETLRAFEDGIEHYQRLFRIQPEAIAYDLHPDYLGTRYALERAEREGLPTIGVQHHHAHIAACMAEHGLTGERPVIGVSFDGTGYGDGRFGETGVSDETLAIWGGEFLLADYTSYQRVYHLAYVPLPGGDKAIREPWRIALAHLYQAGIAWDDDLPPVQYAQADKSASGNYPITQLPITNLKFLHHQLQTRINSPLTSSMGRLFDAVAALIGVCQTVNYEAQAAIELEALVDGDLMRSGGEITANANYQLPITNLIFDPTPLLHAVVTDLRAGVPLPTIAARFHIGVAEMVRQVCQKIRTQYGVDEVALSGGVWQNIVLLTQTIRLLQQEDFTVYTHRQVPPNDGGLALGQAVTGWRSLSR